MLTTKKSIAIERLETAIKNIPRDKDAHSEIFHAWREQTIADLKMIFGNYSTQAKRFEDIYFLSTSSIRCAFDDDEDAVDRENDRIGAEAYHTGIQKAERNLHELLELVNAQPDIPTDSPMDLRWPSTHESSKPLTGYTHPSMIQVSKGTAVAKLREALAIPRGSNAHLPAFHGWHEKTIIALGTIFGDESTVVRRFKEIQFSTKLSQQAHSVYRAACERAENMLKGLLERVEAMPDEKPNPNEASATTPNQSLNKKVFVVHGHDGRLKNAVRAFLKDLGLTPIILHERPDKGRTIIEKFEEESDVGHAVVLATGDDLAASKLEFEKLASVSTGDLTERARQNVIGELMGFVSKIGRDKVTLITEPSVQLPTDLQGVIYALRSEWQLRLIVALIDADYQFTMQQIRDALSIRE